MPKADDLPYFALTAPLSCDNIVTLLGRAIPLNQLRNPLQGKMRPLSPDPVHTIADEDGGGQPRVSSDVEGKPTAFDSASAVTEVGEDQIGVNGGKSFKASRAAVDLVKLVPGLYPQKAVVCRDVEILKKKAAGGKAKVAVENMISAYTNFDQTKETNIKATSFRRIGIPSPQDRIEELLDKPQYADPILDLLRKQENQRVAIIVSVLTFTDMKRSQKATQDLKTGVAAKTPGLQEGQVAPSVEAEIQGTKTTSEEFSGTYDGEVIMACSYLKLRLVPAPPEDQGAWYKISRAFCRYVLQQKPLKANDKMTVSAASLNPKDEELYMPSEPIKGNIPTLFGGPARSTTGVSVKSEGSDKTANEDLAFIICA